MNRPDYTSTTGAGTQAKSSAERLFSESIGFLKNLRSNGPWVLTAIIPDGHTTTTSAQTAAEINAFVREHNGKLNIYYSVNPLRHLMFKKAAKTDIAAIEYLLADLDPADGETPEAAKVRYLALLETFEPKPIVIVDSGNGIQCLWRLTDAIVLPEEESVRKAIIEDAEARSEALMLRLGAKPGTQNIDRILRLPGTINLPNAKKRKAGRVECPTKLISFSEVSYPLESFPLPEQNKPGSPEDGGHHARHEAHGVEALVKQLNKKMRALLNDEKVEDRSDACWDIIMEMLKKKFSDEEMFLVLRKHNRGPASHYTDEARLREDIQRVRQKFVSVKSKKGWGTLYLVKEFMSKQGYKYFGRMDDGTEFPIDMKDLMWTHKFQEWVGRNYGYIPEDIHATAFQTYRDDALARAVEREAPVGAKLEEQIADIVMRVLKWQAPKLLNCEERGIEPISAEIFCELMEIRGCKYLVVGTKDLLYRIKDRWIDDKMGLKLDHDKVARYLASIKGSFQFDRVTGRCEAMGIMGTDNKRRSKVAVPLDFIQEYA